jgi:DNA polymerase-3 subunit beta
MKISTLQENFKNGLFVVGHISGKNINLPILNNVMIEAKEKNIRLITTDLEMGIKCQVRGKIERAGSFTVDAKIISDYISLLPNKKIDIEKGENKLLIKSDNYKTGIKGWEADEFPLIPQIDKKTYYKVNVDDFKKALAQVIFAVSTSETRIELSGVLFNFNKEKLVLAATDSYRLAEKEINITTNQEEAGGKNIIIPAKTLQELLRILSGIKEEAISEESKEIQFYISENQILFILGHIELVSRIIEGQYPDYRQIIPTGSETRAVINRTELIRAVKASSIFSKTGINDINLDFPLGKKAVIVSSASSQTGENTTELDATVNGKDNGLVVNYRYLLDGLNNMDSENVKIEVTNGNTPCIIRPDKEEDYLYIIMPIKQ